MRMITRHIATVGAFMLIGCGSSASAEDHPHALAPNAMGSGWRFKRLDLDVHVLPQKERIEVEGRATLQLIGDESFGPSFGMNAQTKILRFDRLDAPLGATVAINKRAPGATHHYWRTFASRT